jgi:hypothetical protein
VAAREVIATGVTFFNPLNIWFVAQQILCAISGQKRTNERRKTNRQNILGELWTKTNKPHEKTHRPWHGEWSL